MRYYWWEALTYRHIKRENMFARQGAEFRLIKNLTFLYFKNRRVVLLAEP